MPRTTSRNHAAPVPSSFEPLTATTTTLDEPDYGHEPIAEHDPTDKLLNVEPDDSNDSGVDGVVNPHTNDDLPLNQAPPDLPLKSAPVLDPIAAMTINDRELAKLLLMLPLAQLKRSIKSQMGDGFDPWFEAIETALAARQRLSEAIVDQAMQGKG